MSKFTWTSKLATEAKDLYIATGNDNAQLDSIAKELGTTVPSVRGKLAIMGIYTKAEKTAGKKGGVPASAQTKAATLKAIEIMLSIPAGELASIDTVKAINSLFEALKTLSLETNGKLGLKES